MINYIIKLYVSSMPGVLVSSFSSQSPSYIWPPSLSICGKHLCKTPQFCIVFWKFSCYRVTELRQWHSGSMLPLVEADNWSAQAIRCWEWWVRFYQKCQKKFLEALVKFCGQMHRWGSSRRFIWRKDHVCSSISHWVINWAGARNSSCSY